MNTSSLFAPAEHFDSHFLEQRAERPQPLSGNQMPRCGGITTMMRLPHVQSAQGLDACFVGVPFDLGTSNRTGARFGPRQVRSESVLLRPYNMATRAAPFDSLRVADLGDVAINPYNLLDSIVDNYKPALDELSLEIAELEQEALQNFHAGVAIIEGLVGNPFALARESAR